MDEYIFFSYSISLCNSKLNHYFLFERCFSFWLFCLGPLVFLFCLCPLLFLFCLSPLVFLFCLGPLVFLFCLGPLVFLFCLGPLVFLFCLGPLVFLFCLGPLVCLCPLVFLLLKLLNYMAFHLLTLSYLMTVIPETCRVH